MVFNKLYNISSKLFIYYKTSLITITVFCLCTIYIVLTNSATIFQEILANKTHLHYLYGILTIPMLFITIFIHECGHGIFSVHFGSPIKRASFGIYWFIPVAIMDTSGMWLKPTQDRVWVDLGGIICQGLLISIIFTLAYISAIPSLVQISWLFMIINMLNILTNLNPLIKLDGYYFLMDFFNKPNLHEKSIDWLINNKNKSWLKDIEGLFWLISLFFIVILVAITFWFTNYIFILIFETQDNIIFQILRALTFICIISLSLFSIFLDIKHKRLKYKNYL